ncbi:MAG TPA: phenylalanine--tRNA ligase subunit beta, partial [Marinilabiliales bacterium]|nr:phenylalanine--tRNA ligase subunit beta [Marinilabiliales bacterium]
MNLSYNWLKQYLPIDLEPQKLSEILTSIGLEVGGYDSFQSVKGGLEGLVIGEVLTCAPHPDSDHLSLTTVDLGDGNPTPIVCGAKNVATGQKVVVATIGTTLYQGNESFAIKKSKIRGAESMGMICAEDEIGIGTSHDGIMVLPKEVPAGTLAKDYFNMEDDIVFEVDLTPNRIDAVSHVGIARDVAAYLKQKQDIEYHLPSVD